VFLVDTSLFRRRTSALTGVLGLTAVMGTVAVRDRSPTAFERQKPAAHAPSSRPLAAACPVRHGPRLRWIEEEDPQARRVYRRFGGGQGGVPDIYKAMSLRPELMEKVLDLSERGHFADGYLDRRTKERIATFVSALNGSPYCLGSHAGGLRKQGSSAVQVAALARGDLAGAGLPARERALLEFVRRLTLKPGEVTDGDVERLRQEGWSDEQIFEAAFEAALFAFFNRVASAYGLDSPPDGWRPSRAKGAGKRRPHATASGLP
jgi:uncharacterized peroxidase-related enzyme